MSDKYHNNRKILLIAISTAVFAGSFVISSQFVQSSMAQDFGQLGEQIRERTGGEIGQLTDGNETGNQTGNQTDNQSSAGVEQLAEQARRILGQ
jgi:hypothetical protein